MWMAPKVLFVGVTWLVLLSASRAEACSCFPSGPPCQAAWETETIFRARVLSVTALDSRNVLSPRRVRMRVLEAFRGIDVAEVDVFTGGGGGDCGYDFSSGGEYLVYAQRSGERASLHRHL